jgi:CheY-like chemotaxis protein
MPARAVLLVSDHPELLEFLGCFFRVHGWLADRPDPDEGPTRKLERRDYDLVAVDADLPVADGVEFVRGMRLRGSIAPVLIVSRDAPAPEFRERAGRLFNALLVDDAFDAERLALACARLLAMTTFRRRTGA